jgi:hypothetical protein
MQAAQVAQAVDECPICLEEIVGLKNRVTTECGHTFHCRCLLTNVAHNGFGCPFCRTELADEVVDSDDDESEYDEDEYTPARYDDDDEEASRASDYDDDDDDFENEIGYMYHRITQMEEDHLLRGFRWLFQPLNEGAEDEEDEEEAAEEAAVDDLSSYPINITINSGVAAAENQVIYNQWPEESSSTSPTHNSIREYFQNAGFTVKIHSKEEDEEEEEEEKEEDE